MRVKLVQIDGKLPNLALMQLASWHKARGDEVVYTRDTHHDLFEAPPPVAVRAEVIERDGRLIALTPGHNPTECGVASLNKHVGNFWIERK